MSFYKYLIPVFIIFFMSSCNNDFDSEELENIKVGDSKELLYSKVGTPSKIENIDRWIYEGNNSIYISKGKVKDFFLSPVMSLGNDDVTTIEGGDVLKNRTLSDVRIGMTREELLEFLGKPQSIEKIEIVYFKKHQKIIVHNNSIESIDLHAFQDLAILDKVRLNFNGSGMLVINFALAIIMFGVAIEIEFKHFKEVLKHPKSMMVGVFAQFIALPVLTFLFILLIKPTASVALGMILVAASPGGNISNFMTSLAKGNSALSISLTAFATVMAIFMTPLNFSFWGNLYTETSGTLIPIKIDAYQMVKTVMLLLGIPVILGLLFRKYFTELALKIAKPLKTFSLIFFIGLIVGALSMNFDFFIDYIHLIVLMVFAHNLIALFTGYSLAVVFKLPKIDRRTLSIETGIQNSGLALVLIFNPKLFDGLGGMAFVAAWWGIWHIISGLVVANFFKRIPTGDDA